MLVSDCCKTLVAVALFMMLSVWLPSQTIKAENPSDHLTFYSPIDFSIGELQYSAQYMMIPRETAIDRRRMSRWWPGFDFYLGTDYALWSSNFGADNTAGLMRNVELQPYSLTIARLRLINILRFSFYAEAKFTDAQSLQDFWDSRSLDVVGRQQAAELRTVTKRSLSWLDWLIEQSGEYPSGRLHHIFTVYEFHTRQYNWDFVTPRYIAKDGTVTIFPTPKEVRFPSDVTEHRYSLLINLMAMIDPELAEDLNEGFIQEDFPIWSFFNPGISLGFFRQKITYPFDLRFRPSLSQGFQPGQFREVAILDNDFSGFMLKFHMSDPELAYLRLAQPFIFNLYWNVLMGYARLSSDVVSVDKSWATSHEFGFDFIFRRYSWFEARTGWKYHVFGYGPIYGSALNDLTPEITFTETVVVDQRVYPARSVYDLTYYRSESFHSFYFELAISF